jgi:hypothetical protein
MGSRILNITACCFVAVWPIASHGQVPNAETVTQSVLDQHKIADPTNSDRALTGKSGGFDISKIPPPSGPSPETLQRIRELEEAQKQFVKKEIQTASAKARPGAFDAKSARQQANQKWEKTDPGKTLQLLQAEKAEASKAQRRTEFNISNVPLPRSRPK